MKKYLYLVCLLCCCAFVSNIQVVSAQLSAPYVRVGLLQGVQEIVITANDDFVVKDVDNKVNYKFKKMNEVNIRQKDRTVYVNKKGKETTTLVVAVKDNAPVIVNGKRYRGNLIIQPHKAGLTVINRLLIDEYLYGVVPEEMPASWNIEALKAQAVAARTFALYDKLDRKHTKEGFDVCVTTDCQVYGGMDSEAATTNKAIDATKGEVIVYLNQPICSVFHAASGGQTDDSINVWNVNVPYLRAVEDKEEQSPYQSWAVSVTVDNLSKSIKNSYSDIGTIKEIDFSGLKKNPNKASIPMPPNRSSSVNMLTPWVTLKADSKNTGTSSANIRTCKAVSFGTSSTSPFAGKARTELKSMLTAATSTASMHPTTTSATTV